MPHCLVLVGHPLHPSFCLEAAKRYAAMLEARGWSVELMQLADLSIPELGVRKPGDKEMVGDVRLFWESLVAADHFVVVHPLWWGGAPAKLKALFDIALQPGKAFRYAGAPLPEGLLKGRSARAIITSDTPHWFMVLGYGAAHFRALRRQILGFVGLAPVRLTHLSVMQGSDAAKRARLLAQVERAAARDSRRTYQGKPTESAHEKGGH